ncbi:MAG: isoprenylcysteine carboxylmethyltransferase family protein [Pseudomonadota bacterium]
MLKQLNIPPVWTLGALVMVVFIAQFDPMPLLPLKAVAGLLIFVGLSLFFWSTYWFKRKSTTIVPRQKPQALIFEGPFKISRNPIYLAFILIVEGAAFWMGSLLALIVPVWLFFFFEKNYVLPEERKMREGLGDAAVDAYFARTGRWLWFL